MLVHTAKEVCPAMHIKHNSLTLSTIMHSLNMVNPHLYPFRFQRLVVPAPLPPFATTHFVNAVMAQLSSESICRLGDDFVWYFDYIHLDPMRVGHPLRGKTLDIFDCVEGGIMEKLANEVQSLVI